MASTAQIAKTLRVAHGIPTSQDDIACLGYGLIAADGTVILDATKLQQGDAAQIELLQELLGGNDQIGSVSTVAAGSIVTLGANSQAIAYGPFTIYGTLKIYGEMRFGAWPF